MIEAIRGRYEPPQVTPLLTPEEVAEAREARRMRALMRRQETLEARVEAIVEEYRTRGQG